MVYIEPNITPMDMASWFHGVNDATGGWMGLWVMIATYVIIFISFKSYSSAQAFMVTNFVSLILSIAYLVIGIIPEIVVLFVIIFFGISLMFLHSERSNNPS